MAAPQAVPQQRIDYAATLSSREKWFILAGVLITLFLAALDNTIVSTAQPAIIAAFKGIDLISWVTSGYLLANTAMVPILGKLSDLYGRKIIMMVSTVIFLIGSALCGTALNMGQLIGYRVLQGVGAAGIIAMSFAIIADLWVPAERAKISGLISSVFGLAGVFGPFAGGWLTDHVSWRAVFYINVPIGIIAVLFVAAKMPRLASGIKAPIDWAGTFTLLTTVLPFLLALTLDKSQHAWTSPLILGLFAVAAVGLVSFLYAETRAVSPILPLKLFKNRTFAVSTFGSFLFGAAFFGGIIYLAIFMVGVVGVSATKAGSALMPMMGGLVVSSIVSSLLAQRSGRYKPFVIGGFAIVTLGLYLMSTMGPDTTLAGMTWRMVVLGLGVGPVLPLLNLAVTNAVPMDQMGTATSSRTFFQNIGQTLAVAVFGVIMTSNLTSQINTNMAPIKASLPAAFADRFDSSQMRNQFSGGGEGGGGAVDISGKITEQIHQAFADLRLTLTKALKDGDATAADALLQNPLAPAQLKDAVKPGGIEALVQQGMDTQFNAIALILRSGNTDALKLLVNDPKAPAALRESLGKIPPQALKDPQAVEGILAGLKQGQAAQKPLIVAQAKDGALKGALNGLGQAEADAVKTGEETGAKVSRALKQSFSAAVTPLYFYGMLIGFAGLLLMLLLPELALRGRKELPMDMPGH